MTAGTDLIAWERKRQIEKEGWSAEHDDEAMLGELARAGACYVVAGVWDVLDRDQTGIRKILGWLWPPTWSVGWWKPKDKKRNLIRAGALIAAEIDRLLRAEDVEIDRAVNVPIPNVPAIQSDCDRTFDE